MQRLSDELVNEFRTVVGTRTLYQADNKKLAFKALGNKVGVVEHRLVTNWEVVENDT